MHKHFINCRYRIMYIRLAIATSKSYTHIMHITYATPNVTARACMLTPQEMPQEQHCGERLISGTSKCSCDFLASTGMGKPSGPGGAFRAGFWYKLGSSSVGLMVGLLCRREHLSPCLQALQASTTYQRYHPRVEDPDHRKGLWVFPALKVYSAPEMCGKYACHCVLYCAQLISRCRRGACRTCRGRCAFS